MTERMEDKDMKERKRIKVRNAVGGIVFMAQGVAAAMLIVLLLRFPVLPGRYMAAVYAIVAAVTALTAYLLFLNGGRKRLILGIVVSITVTILYAVGFYYLEKARSTVENITGGDKEMIAVEEMAVVVLREDSAKNLKDTLAYTYGLQNAYEYDNSLAVVEYINKTYSTSINARAYDNYSELAAALLSKEVQAMILDRSFVELLFEYEEGFEEQTRILQELSFEAELPVLSITPTPNPTETPTPSLDPNATPVPITPTPTIPPVNMVEMPPREGKTDLTKNYFTVYLSGIDTSGVINVRSRSDVNILMTVNPKTKKILLVTIPRDAYVIIPGISGNSYDKLTHAGIYGVKASMKTLERVYGISIDYYVRVNFTSVERFVNILGGVNVYSAYEFSSGGMNFKKGYNYVNGEQALIFARERKVFSAGDNQRGRNQTELIKAVINKMTTPASLMKFGDIMGAVKNNFQTDLSMDQLTALVRMQLNDSATWTMESYAIKTKGGSNYCYSYKGRKLYVGYIDYTSVDTAVAKMLEIMKGK